MLISDLKPFLDKTITVRMTNGEVAGVRVDFVDEEDEDIIVDVLETTRPDQYRNSSAAYSFAAADIVAVESGS